MQTNISLTDSAIQAAADSIPDLSGVGSDDLTYPCVWTRKFQYWDDTRTTYRWVDGIVGKNHKGWEIAAARFGYDHGDNVRYMQVAVATWEAAYESGRAWGAVVSRDVVAQALKMDNSCWYDIPADEDHIARAVETILMRESHGYDESHKSAWAEGAADAIMPRGFDLWI